MSREAESSRSISKVGRPDVLFTFQGNSSSNCGQHEIVPYDKEYGISNQSAALRR
jgi:hypothetical protein